ncbi:MAG: glycosyltransferase family 4 protein [Candidatus Nanopelagicaceae bacterium]|nr:glycosyltransferase family 4 protein [Candidatus Nanopelagicaceae bacterium]
MSSKKKLCIATGIFPPDKGGPAQFSSAFSSWLSRQGVESTVLSLTDQNSRQLEDGLVKVDLISRKISTPARMALSAFHILKLSSTHKFLINGLFLEALIASIFKRIEYTAKVPGDIVWERARNKGLTELDIDEFQKSEPRRLALMRWAFTKSLKGAKKIIAPSTHLKNLIIAWGVDPSRIVVIPNSVDTDTFRPNPDSKKMYDFITVCRLVPWKGLVEVIETCSRNNLSLLIVGSGPQEAELRALSNKLNAKVEFAGEVPQSRLPEYLNQARFFVLNSSYEGSPHSLIEAMSCALPVIARENTGTSELVSSGKNGLLVGKSRSLEDAFKLVLGNEIDAKSLSKAAREEILNYYSRDKIFGEIVDLVGAR